MNKYVENVFCAQCNFFLDLIWRMVRKVLSRGRQDATNLYLTENNWIRIKFIKTEKAFKKLSMVCSETFQIVLNPFLFGNKASNSKPKTYTFHSANHILFFMCTLLYIMDYFLLLNSLLSVVISDTSDWLIWFPSLPLQPRLGMLCAIRDIHATEITRIVHGTYLSVPSHSKLCLSHPTGFPL